MTPAVAEKETAIFNLNEEIKSAISRGAVDPYKIAKDLAPKVPKEEMMEMVELHIVTLARRAFSDNRVNTFVQTVVDDGERIDTFDSDRFRLGRVAVGDGTRFRYVRYAHLTAEDCDKLAGQRTVLSKTNAKQAQRFKSLAAAIRKASVTTAGELSELTLAGILK